MGKKNKQQTQQQQSFQNTYSTINPQGNEYTQSLQDWKPQVDPSVGYSFARARRNIANTFQNPLGGYTSAGTREAEQRNRYQDLGQQEAQAMQEAAFAANQQEYAKRLALADMLGPKVVQTGGSGQSSGTTVQTQSPGIAGILGGAAQVGLAF